MSGFKRNSRTSGILFLIVIFQVPGPSMARPFPKARSQNGNRTTANVDVLVPIEASVNDVAAGVNVQGQTSLILSVNGSDITGVLAGTGLGGEQGATFSVGVPNSTGGVFNGITAAIGSGMNELGDVTIFATVA